MLGPPPSSDQGNEHPIRERRRGAKDDKWSRADLIAMVTALVALFTALAPYVEQVVHNIWGAPNAVISDANVRAIAAKGQKCSIEFTADGGANRISAGYDLWLVGRSRQGLWYPVTRVSNGTWSAPGTLRTTLINLPVSMDLVLLSDSRDGPFIRYTSQRKVAKDSLQQGLSALPSDGEVLNVDSLKNLRPDCLSARQFSGRIPGF
jgi:hypothetical protein